MNMSKFENSGHCPCCNKDVTFIATSDWYRDGYICSNCTSIPRERALMTCLENFYPDWHELTIHESSPAFRGASKRVREECANYIPSQYYPHLLPGTIHDGFQCENLENLTFKDESIDIHITQDVFEHILDPDKAFKEIERTLKPGGAHIFTVPLVRKNNPSMIRAIRTEKKALKHLLEPVFHGNPIDSQGSLVTVDWGYDICEYIFRHSGLFTHMVTIDDISQGIRAELNEVLITVKRKI